MGETTTGAADTDEDVLVLDEEPSPDRIMMTAGAFWASKVLLSAVGLGLFTEVARHPMTGSEVEQAIGLHPRATYDFLDALVALGFLERDGDGPEGRYRNAPDTDRYLDARKDEYVGGLLEMQNDRLFRFWADLDEALVTGEPQNELKHGGTSMFDELYSDPHRLEAFADAMSAASRDSFEAFAASFDFDDVETVLDVGGSTGLLSIILAEAHPHLQCTTFDLPAVAPIAERHVEAAEVADRVTVASGDFFTDPLPPADLITMGMILHDWDLEGKMHLLRSAYEALPDGGALVAIDRVIDDARRTNVQGLLMSLNMLIEFGDAFDYTGADFIGWCEEVGFSRCEIRPLSGATSAAIAWR